MGGKSAKQVQEEADAALACTVKKLRSEGQKRLDEERRTVLNDNDPNKFKVDRILREQTFVEFLSKKDGKAVKDGIRSVVKSIAQVELSNMIEGVLCSGVDAVISGSLDARAEKRLYTVNSTGIAIQRVDVYFYAQADGVAGVVNEYQKLFVASYRISSIADDITKKDLRNFVALYVPDVDENEKKLSPMELIRQQNEVYKALEPLIK